MPETIEGLPVPDLEPRPITSQRRRELLQLLLANAGLLEAVRLAPQELWRDALRRVYGLGLG